MSRVPFAVIGTCVLAQLSGFNVPVQQPKTIESELARPIVKGLRARCIGPANMGGRITDLAVVESNPDVYYVAGASGGIWKTVDAGSTFTPTFENQPTQCIGAIALCQGKPEVVYVGTGEANLRNSVSWGCGIFRSADGGKSWKHCGLAETHHVGRVVVHPENPDVVYVAALGRCWGPNKERGLYKTTNGGESWECSKFIDENTGFIDVCMDPTDPDTLYAAAWQVRRDGFAGGNPRTQVGPNGGLFRTSDGGKTWEKMGGGLPEKVGYGRCGLAVYRKDPRVVYAVVHTSETVGQITNLGQPPTALGKDGKPGPLGKVETGGIFRSDDRGKTWKKVNDLVPRPFYYGQIRIDPTDENHTYVLGVAFQASTDGGRTFTAIGRTIHADHHALWINPKNPRHLIVGNDGGLYASKDRGRTFEPKRGLVLSQFYGIAVDNRTPYRVYGGLQDNGSWGCPVATAHPDGITLADWKSILLGDGFQAAVDPTNPNVVYLEAQFGALSRVNVGGAKGPFSRSIRPPTPRGDFLRFNWNAPILLSPHDSKTLYYGAQYLFKSTNRGDTWEKISSDLTSPPKDFPPFPWAHTILSLAESPVKAGVLWVGTDDGRVWVSRNDGKDWTDVGANILGVPRTRAISKIECSHFTPGTAMIAIDRHRNDDFKPYVYITTDYGNTWRPIAGNLPHGAVVGVIRQSSKEKYLLFAGTEIGLFVTFDAGTRWHHLDATGLPKGIRIDDLLIHPRERELVIGTHGRGIWIMDVAPLEQIDEKILAADVHLFDVKPVTLFKRRDRKELVPPGFRAQNPRAGIAVSFLHTPKVAGKLKIQLESPSPNEEPKVLLLARDCPAGLHTEFFEVEKPGEYTVTLTAGELKQTKKVTVKTE